MWSYNIGEGLKLTNMYESYGHDVIAFLVNMTFWPSDPRLTYIFGENYFFDPSDPIVIPDPTIFCVWVVVLVLVTSTKLHNNGQYWT